VVFVYEHIGDECLTEIDEPSGPEVEMTAKEQFYARQIRNMFAKESNT
jgi:hypothetical protein